MPEHNATKEHNIDHLELKVKELIHAFKGFSDDRDLHELIVNFRKPWFTTPAEYNLIAGLLEGLAAQVKAIADQRAGLVRGVLAVAPSQK